MISSSGESGTFPGPPGMTSSDTEVTVVGSVEKADESSGSKYPVINPSAVGSATIPPLAQDWTAKVMFRSVFGSNGMIYLLE
jgi:hypothetical protein